VLKLKGAGGDAWSEFADQSSLSVVFGIIEIQRTAAKMSQEKLKIKKA
jgi:hypothetical protein